MRLGGLNQRTIPGKRIISCAGICCGINFHCGRVSMPWLTCFVLSIPEQLSLSGRRTSDIQDGLLRGIW